MGASTGSFPLIAQQPSHPTVLMGSIVAHLMSCRNARTNEFTIRQLNLSPADRVLEIGFGSGVNIPRLVAQAAFVAGVDRSNCVVDRANKRFARDVLRGRADFRTAAVESLPFEASAFNKACTVNSIYFWDSLEEGFREIHRVLTPGGQLAIGFLPKRWMSRLGPPADIFKLRTPDEVMIALTRSGFVSARIERPRPEAPWNVVVATRGPNKRAARCRFGQLCSSARAGWSKYLSHDRTTDEIEVNA